MSFDFLPLRLRFKLVDVSFSAVRFRRLLHFFFLFIVLSFFLRLLFLFFRVEAETLHID